MITSEHSEKPEMGNKDPDAEKKEWSDVPAEGLQEILPSEDELDRLHEKKMKKIPRSEVQKIIDDLNREDAEQKKHEKDVDKVIDEKRKQGK